MSVAVTSGLVDRLTDRWLGLRVRLGWLPPVALQTFASLGGPERLTVRGRVTARPPMARASADTARWRNVLAVVRRFTAADIPGARVRVDLTGRGFGARQGPGESLDVLADDEGYFLAHVPLSAGTPPDLLGWRDVLVELAWPVEAGGARLHAVAPVLVASPSARFAVVSDLDDTVLRTGLTEGFKALQVTLLNNAHTRLPFPGVAAFYQALRAGAAGGANPLAYVSGSPWMLYDLLEEFLSVHGIPAGPVELMGWAKWTQDHTQRDRYKQERIRHYLTALPHLPFLLIGDSGQRDPEIYAEAVRRHPGRILAVYIRDVSPPARDAEVHAIARHIEADGVPVVLSADTLPAAEHASSLGLITRDAVAAVREQVRAAVD